MKKAMNTYKIEVVTWSNFKVVVDDGAEFVSTEDNETHNFTVKAGSERAAWCWVMNRMFGGKGIKGIRSSKITTV